jgi:hypothetical protein
MRSSDMLPYIALFALAELADLATWATMNPLTHTEGNPLVVWLGWLAGPAKLVLVATVSYLAYRLPGPGMAAVLCFGAIGSVIGALSNVL